MGLSFELRKSLSMNLGLLRREVKDCDMKVGSPYVSSIPNVFCCSLGMQLVQETVLLHLTFLLVHAEQVSLLRDEADMTIRDDVIPQYEMQGKQLVIRVGCGEEE